MGRALVSAPATLGALAALLVCWSLQTGWKASFGPFLNWLGSLGLSIRLPRLPDVSLHPFGFAHTLDRNIRRWLSQSIAFSEHQFVRFLTYTVEPFVLAAGVTLALALTLKEGIDALWAQVDRLQAAALGGASRGISALVHKIVNGAIALERKYWHAVWSRTDARARHAEAVADNAFEFPRPRLGKLDKTKVGHKDLSKWLKLTLLGTLGLLVVKTALGKLGLGCLLGRNGKKAVGSLCKINPGLLDSLLLDAAVLAVAFDLEDFARELGDVAGAAAGLINRWAT